MTTLKQCPYCAEQIQPDAIKCRYCGEWLDERNQSGAYPTTNLASTVPPSAFMPPKGFAPPVAEQAPPVVRPCPYCKSALRPDAVFCGHCGQSVSLTAPGAEVARRRSAPALPHQTLPHQTLPHQTFPPENSSGKGKDAILPAEIKGFNCGAFVFFGIWSLFYNVYSDFVIWLIFLAVWFWETFVLRQYALTYLLSFVISFLTIAAGFRGNRDAWRNRKWKSVEHFRKVQRIWAYSALAYLLIVLYVAWVFNPDRAALRGESPTQSLEQAPVEAPAQESVQPQAEEPVQTPVEEPAQEPVEEPVQPPVEGSTPPDLSLPSY